MKLAIAILATVCITALTATLLGLASHSLTPAIAHVSLLAGFLAGTIAWKETKAPEKFKPLGFWDYFTVTTGILFALRAFCWLIFIDENAVKTLSANNYGDLPLHITYINHFASGAAFWPDDPLYFGEKLHYPIGVDLFNALLSLCGIDLFRGLIWSGLVGAFLTGFMIYQWGGSFALAGFLFNGGLVGFRFFRDLRFQDYQDAIAWKSIPLTMLITQRGLLYALPVGGLLLIHWKQKYFQKEPDRKPILPFWLEILFYSTLPLFHVHTFLFFSMLLACWLVVSAHNRGAFLKLIGYSLAPAVVTMSLVTGIFQPRGSAPAVRHDSHGIWGFFDYILAKLHLPFHMQPGWMQNEHGFFTFWLGNFGFWPIIVLALLILLALKSRSEKSEAAHFVYPAIFIFLLTCFVSFAPWEWDNTKIMIWSYLVLLPFVWKELLLRLNEPLRVAAVFALFFSGFVSLIGGIDGTHTGVDLYLRSEVDGVASAIRNIPASATFAARPIHNHPLLLLGRKLAMGYSGHLWSHGIDYEPREAKLAMLMNGSDKWRETAEELGARYLFWGPHEQEAYPESNKPWVKECQTIARGPWGDVFDLEAPAAEKLFRGPQLKLLPGQQEKTKAE